MYTRHNFENCGSMSIPSMSCLCYSPVVPPFLAGIYKYLSVKQLQTGTTCPAAGRLSLSGPQPYPICYTYPHHATTCITHNYIPSLSCTQCAMLREANSAPLFSHVSIQEAHQHRSLPCPPFSHSSPTISAIPLLISAATISYSRGMR